MDSTSYTSAPSSRVTSGGGRASIGGRDGNTATPSWYTLSRLAFSTGCIRIAAGRSSSYALSFTTCLIENGPRNLHANFGVRLSSPTIRKCSVDNNTRSPTLKRTSVDVDQHTSLDVAVPSQYLNEHDRDRHVTFECV